MVMMMLLLMLLLLLLMMMVSIGFKKKIRALLGMFRDQGSRQFQVGNCSIFGLFWGIMSYVSLFRSKVSNICVF